MFICCVFISRTDHNKLFICVFLSIQCATTDCGQSHVAAWYQFLLSNSFSIVLRLCIVNRIFLKAKWPLIAWHVFIKPCSGLDMCYLHFSKRSINSLKLTLEASSFLIPMTKHAFTRETGKLFCFVFLITVVISCFPFFKYTLLVFFHWSWEVSRVFVFKSVHAQLRLFRNSVLTFSSRVVATVKWEEKLVQNITP